MVSLSKRRIEEPRIKTVDIPKDDLNWSTVSLSEVLERDSRLEASTFNIDRKHALQLLNSSKYSLVQLSSVDGGLEKCFYGPRSKRNYLTKVDENSIGFLGSAEMLDIYPRATKYVSSDNPMVKNLSLEYGTILVSRSGTIGNVAFVNRTLEKFLVSEHAIRLIVKDYPGYIYAYLKTNTAQNLLHSEKFGSVILEIEPSSFETMLIPNPPAIVKREIHDMIVESYKKRDESNKLIDEATKLLIEELELPSIEELEKEAFSYSAEINSFSTKLSNLKGRLEGSYHIPIIDLLESYFKKNAIIKYISDKDIIKEIILPSRFSRIYVDEDHGVPFIGGKDLFQLVSQTGKYLSKKAHKDRLEKELLIRPNSIILPSRGTIGSVMLSMPHQVNACAISDNLIQMECNPKYVGYIFAFLNSEYGKLLIYRQKYGGVVNAIEPIQIGNITIPFLEDESMVEHINSIIINANKLRYEAFKLEQKAIKIMNEDVIGI